MKNFRSIPYQRLIALLVDARKDAQMTQQDLSARLGKPQSYVSKYERGERRLDVIEFLQITLNLKTDPYLLLRELEPLLTAVSSWG